MYFMPQPNCSVITYIPMHSSHFQLQLQLQLIKTIKNMKKNRVMQRYMGIHVY